VENCAKVCLSDARCSYFGWGFDTYYNAYKCGTFSAKGCSKTHAYGTGDLNIYHAPRMTTTTTTTTTKTTTTELARFCPDGYKGHDGDVPGGDQFGGGYTQKATSAATCAELCNARAQCGSFEYAPSTKFCFLNRQTVPTVAGAPAGWEFCSKLTCPAGYEPHDGDVPGGDQFGGGYTQKATSAAKCAVLCNAEAQCRSFEYAPSTKFCFLNRQTVPTVAGAPAGWEFCARRPAAEVPPKYKTLPGWATDVALYSAATSPCNVPDFVAALPHGYGYYTDPGVTGGFCRSIAPANLNGVLGAHASGRWTTHHSGKTHLPLYKTLPGWATDVALYSAATSPCNVPDFVAALPHGSGYYTDPGVTGGFCRSIAPANLNGVLGAHVSGRWTTHHSGKTNLPHQFMAAAREAEEARQRLLACVRGGC